MRTRLTLTSGLAATALLLLTGCFGGTGGGTEPGADGSSGAESGGAESGAGGVAGCLQGSWDLDEAALARDLGAQMSSSGLTVVSAEASGPVRLVVAGDEVTYISDVTFTLEVDMGDGLTMIVSQLQAGESSGRFSVDGDQVVFADWVSGIAITNDVTVGGETSSAAIELPESGDGVPMSVVCDGDRLTTHPEGTPFTSVWSRE